MLASRSPGPSQWGGERHLLFTSSDRRTFPSSGPPTLRHSPPLTAADRRGPMARNHWMHMDARQTECLRVVPWSEQGGSVLT